MPGFEDELSPRPSSKPTVLVAASSRIVVHMMHGNAARIAKQYVAQVEFIEIDSASIVGALSAELFR